MASVMVVKCGGRAGIDVAHVCADVAEFVREGHRVALVHGGSGEIDRLASRLGVPQRRLVARDGVSSRYTDERSLEVVTLALAGGVQPRLIGELLRRGVPAVGLTGLDGGLLRARRKRVHRAMVGERLMVVRDDHSGRVMAVHGELLHTLLDAGYVPVVSPPALAEDGWVVNVDADRAAAAVAAALPATVLVLLTGAPGVLRDPADERSVLATLSVAREGRPPHLAGGGMALKLVAARDALVAGVPRVLIADGRREHPVRAALAGAGTSVVLAQAAAS